MNYKLFFKNINNWDDFQQSLTTLDNNQKGNVYEELTLLLFKIKEEYVSQYAGNVWRLSETPKKYLEDIGITSQDLGVDLIAKKDNEYHAIQCKYHSDRKKNVTYNEVSTFLVQLETHQKFTMGYLCSTANETSKNYQKQKTKQIQEKLYDAWEELDKSFFDKVRKYLDKKSIEEKPYDPHEHQIKAIKDAKKHFLKEDNDRGKLIFPCGSGKSLTGFWLTEALDSNSTLIAVPSLSLIKQTLDVYLREIVAKGIKVKWLCICSDEGIGRDKEVVMRTENIGVPCLTDPVYIKNWLKENKNEKKIIFTTYQSGKIIAEISKSLKFKFDVGIFDEAHKTVGSKDKVFSHLLFEKNISISKRIFMTATERFYGGKKDDIISMDDKDVYGDTFTFMSFKEAIDADLLTDYKVITIKVEKSEIADFIVKNKLVELNKKWSKETEARSLASMLALRKAMKTLKMKNVVSFHSSIEKAVRNKELQAHITKTYNYSPIDTYTVSGKDNTSVRNSIIKEFAESDSALITNARCLTEGVDVPNIDCIVFSDPRRSKVDIVQALGRALRKKKGKDWGYVILPIVYNGDTNEIDNENFQEIVDIVRGLASNDERIIEEFKDKAELGKSSGRIFSESDIFHIDPELLNEADLAKNLQIQLWENLSKFQWLPFDEAREFVQSMNFNTVNEWRLYCKSDSKPYNISINPDRIYKNKGWVSWYDWLGTKVGFDGEFRSFVEARRFVHTLGLKSWKEWNKYCDSGEKPDDIPSYSPQTYRNKDTGWIDMPDFLGYRIGGKIQYLSYEKAREFVHDLQLKNQSEWQLFVKSGKKPDNVPGSPSKTYKNKGWINLGDWIGTGTVASREKKYRDFSKARRFVHTLGLKNGTEWTHYCKSGLLPDDIPYTPHHVYKNSGWISRGDWLGTGRRANQGRKYRSFKETRKFIQNLGLKNYHEWKMYSRSSKKPNDIPGSPGKAYKNKGWKGFSDWLGTGTIAKHLRVYRNFKEARKFVNTLGLKTWEDWSLYNKSGKKPNDIPAQPNMTYKNKGWINLGDWLGTGKIANQDRVFRSFKEARKFVHTLNLKNYNEWKMYCKSGKKPDDIYSSPERPYKDLGWKGWGDFLGND